jgi:hypothetical protein
MKDTSQMLNNGQNVQVSDTTDDDSSNAAGPKKKSPP